MTQTTAKFGPVTFSHNDEYKGEVALTRGGQTLSVPIDALRSFVAESIRYDLAAHVQRMKPSDLLRRIA